MKHDGQRHINDFQRAQGKKNAGKKRAALQYCQQKRQEAEKKIQTHRYRPAMVLLLACMIVLAMPAVTWGDHLLFGRHEAEPGKPLQDPHFTVVGDFELVASVPGDGTLVTTWTYQGEMYTMIEDHNDMGTTVRVADTPPGSTEYAAPPVCGQAVQGYEDAEGCSFFVEFKFRQPCLLRISTQAKNHQAIDRFLQSIELRE